MPSNLTASLIAGALIAVVLLVCLMVDRFEIVRSGTFNGAPAIWRTNVRSGDTTICVAITEPKPASGDPVDQYRVQCH